MPIVDLSSGIGAFGEQLGTQLAGPFGPLLGLQQQGFPSSYPIVKRFVQPSTQLRAANGVTDLDDPTYLGFSLQFDITSPLFNGATIGSVDDTNYNINPSACAYLTKIGEITRASYLKAFIQGLMKINSERPYYWQTVEGLSEAWTKNTDFSLDPFVGTADEEGITIGCLEAIDLKLTALFTLYRMAVYDSKYRRQIVPNNLLRFDVTLNVQEIRKFKTVRNWLIALNLSENKPSTKDFINENTSQVSFLFTQCMWDSKASGIVLDNVNNTEMSAAKTDIKFTYANVSEASQFSGFDGKLVGNAKVVDPANKPSFEDKIKSFAKDQLANQAAGAVNNISRTVSSFLQGLTLGNVYGGRNELFAAINNPQSLINAAIGAAVQGTTSGQPGNFAFKLAGNLFPPEGSNRLGGGGGLNISAFDPAPPPMNSLPQAGRILPPANQPTNFDGVTPTISNGMILPGNENIYGSAPSGPPPLTSTNIFG
jgi:hypothetical protein